MNLLYGSIEQQDLAGTQALYRVRFTTGELSPWLTQVVLVAGTTLRNHSLSNGTQVACFMGTYEGLIIGAINCISSPLCTDSDNINRTKYSDGAIIDYNANTHELKAILPGGATTHLTSTGGITIDGDTQINGDLSVDGDFDLTGSGNVGGSFTVAGNCAVGSLSSSAGGSVNATGGMNMTGGDVTVDGISVKGHRHPENGDGGGTTDGPI